ncbi:MAG: citrate synthase family protein [Azospirillaceae bacterium]|nr:citrate synthase family protein [Azospirillaceae bacterium]
MDKLLSATAAAQRLGVTRQTLYAYVSRGLLVAFPGPDPRERRYARDAVEALAHQRRRGRKPKEIAKATIDWGLPVLESGLTLIEQGRLYYRGQDAVGLAAAHSVEAVAALLWQMPERDAFPSGDSDPAPRRESVILGRDDSGWLLSRFAAAGDDDQTADWQSDPGRIAAGCGALVRTLVACLLGTSPSRWPISEQCAWVWGLDPTGADLIRSALILCADHELNASCFTARCIASTGASLRATLIGGLAALTGPRHGGTTIRVEALFRNLEGYSDHTVVLHRMLDSGAEIPGFGHPLYPDGDVRARLILDRLGSRFPQANAISDAVFDLTGRRASLDFALVALRRGLGLPEGAALGLFAAGRAVGWIAHALEQRALGQLIRPRARYVGPRPAT